MYLFNNSFTGTLDNLSDGINLRKLKVSNNSLEGDITPKLGNLEKIEILSLDGNKLVGEVPAQLQKLTSLKDLQLQNNLLSGTIPRGLCDLRKSSLQLLVSDCAGNSPAVTCSCCTSCVGA